MIDASTTAALFEAETRNLTTLSLQGNETILQETKLYREVEDREKDEEDADRVARAQQNGTAEELFKASKSEYQEAFALNASLSLEAQTRAALENTTRLIGSSIRCTNLVY